MSTAPTLPRVKVYKLNPDDNQWADSGTGHVQLDFVEKFSCFGIIVVSEEDSSSVILQTKVCVDDIYQQQQDTLIVWNEPETEEDLALSFVDKKSCLELWNNLCKTQQRLKNAEKELPAPTIENLEAIDKLINEISLSNRENLGISIYAEERYLDSLFELSTTLTPPNQLEQIFSIFKGMILLNEPNLLEVLLSDDYILKLMDVLRCDPKIPKSKRVNHRKFLTEVSVFKEVIPIKDEELISKIHQTFRIKYLRDSVLISVLDDTTCSTLNTMIYYNNIEILSLLQNNQQFLNDLFSALVNKENTVAQKIDYISFLQQFCELAKNLQDESRINFYKTLQKLGLFDLFEIYLSEMNRSVILPSLDLLNNTITHLPIEIREFFVSTEQSPDYPSFSAIVNCMLKTEDHGVMGQIAEMIRRLVDIESVEPNAVPDQKFIKMFYPKFVVQLADATLPDYEISHTLFNHYNLVNQIYDIFAFCIPKHGFRIREFILHSELLEKSFRYLETDGFLTLSVIRLFRAVLGQKNRNFERKILKLNLFAPIMNLFRANGSRNNMINSAILELFWFIDQECYNNHKLIAHLVENYREDFEKVTYVTAFRNLITKYDNHREIVNSNPQESTKKRKRDEAFELEDESYFENSDDDNDYHAATPPTENGDEEDEQNIGSGLPPLSKKSEDEEETTVVSKANKKPLQISIKSKKKEVNNNSESKNNDNNDINHKEGNNNVEKFDTEKVFVEDDSDLKQKVKRQKLSEKENEKGDEVYVDQ